MKTIVKGWGISAFAVLLVFAIVSCDNGTTPPIITPPQIINIAAIGGVIAPVTGETPVDAITPTAQYTGTVSWNGNPYIFAAATQYTVTITLTAKSGHTLEGVKADFFSVAGAISVSNAANSGIITAVFPKTAGTEEEPAVIDIAAIGGITLPVIGEIPVTAITENAQYTGTVSWNDNPDTFAAATQYTAVITLTPKTGYTLQGVAANFFTIDGTASVNHAENSGVITAVFPTTAVIIDIAAISGVTAPANGGIPVIAITENEQYTGTVTWNGNPYTFASSTVYTATITLTPKTGYTLQGVAENFFTVTGATPVSNAANSGVITAVFPATAATVITSASITITAPVKGAAPGTTASGTGNFDIGAVSWSPVNNPFQGGVVYIASVMLTANSGYTFTGLSSASINGQNAAVTNNNGSTVTLSYTFPATDTKTVTGIAIKTQLAKLTYTHGDTLDMAGLVVTLTYDDTTTEDVAAANFTAKNITANPAQSSSLVRSTHNGKPVTITYGSLTLNTNNLTVNPKVTTFTIDAIPVHTYTGSAVTPAVIVKDGSTTLTHNTDYTVSYSNNTNAGTATVTISGAGNYSGSSGSRTFTINAKVITFTINAIPDQTYTGSAITPTVTVKDGSTTLTLNTDYTVSYSSNTNIGTVATVTVTGAGNYAGSTGSKIFTINAKVITFTIDAIAAQPYTGSVVTPTVTVKDGSTTLTLDTHYTVSYSNNTNAGTATVTVTGVESYAGSTGNRTFTINPKVITFTVEEIPAQNYTGSAITPTVTVKDGSTTLTLTTHYTVSYSSNTNAGTATATVNGAGNYAGSTGSRTFTINAPYSYIITGSGTSFTATRGGSTVGTANDTIQNVINAIRTNANGNAASIQFGNGTNTLDIGTAIASFNNTGGTWGAVTLTGKITSSATPSGTIVVANNISVTSTADITNTNENTTTNAVYFSSTGTLSISGGTVSSIYGNAVRNASSGTVTISAGGTVSTTTGIAVNNYSSGTVTISGGTVLATTGRAVDNYSGTVTISGGTVSATTGIAVYDGYRSKGITVSGTAQVTSANVTATEGTIYLAGDSLLDITSPRLRITSGPVSNTAVIGGRAIYSDSPNEVYIYNAGKVQATGTGGYAVVNTNANAMLTMEGNPTVTGLIRPSAAGKLKVGTSLGSGPYILDYASYGGGNNIAVVGGANYLSRFTLYNQPNLRLEVSGNNLVISVVSDPNAYVITGSGTSFTASKNGSTVGTANQAIQTVINGVRTNANGAAATIQFVNGISALNIGTASASFNNTGGTWGAVTLTGKITSSVSSATSGTIVVANNISVTSTADITNTNETNTTSAVYFNSTGTLTISGGTVSSTNGIAVRNASYGTVTISGGTVSTAGYDTGAVRNTSSGTVNISGGTVSETGNGGLSYAVHNSGEGAVNISGGTVSAIYGIAVSNASTGGVTGNITISGGTVLSTSIIAVSNSSSGKIIVSGTALVTSGNINTLNLTSPGTIRILSGGLEITGGTVSKTTDNGRAIYVSSGAVTISGGTVSVSGPLGVAVYNASTSSKITVSGTALVTSENTSFNEGTIYLASAQDPSTVQLEVNGGNIRNTAWTSSNSSGIAIYNYDKGTITVTGGVVQSKMGRAIMGTDMDTGDNQFSSMLNFTGGVLFCYYSSSAPNPAIGVTINADNGYRISGIWENKTSFTYTAGTNTDIIVSPSATASGMWAKNGGRSGINFTRNGVTTFVAVDDVTVN